MKSCSPVARSPQMADDGRPIKPPRGRSTGGGDKRQRSPVPPSTERSGKRRTLSSDHRHSGAIGLRDVFPPPDIEPAAPASRGRRSRTLLLHDGFDVEVARMNMATPATTEEDSAGYMVWAEGSFNSHVADTLFSRSSTRMEIVRRGVLRHVESPPQPAQSSHVPAPRRGRRQPGKVARSLPQVADRVLDAPNICTDPCMTLIHMSASCHRLAVALNDTVYIWDGKTGDSGEFFSTGNPEKVVTSVAWQDCGSVCAAGTSSGGSVQLWDAHTCRRLRSMAGHTGRVCALAWSEHVVTSGGEDGVVIHHDVRVKHHKAAVLAGHKSEVCSVKYSEDYCTLATGDADGTVLIWDAAAGVARHKQEIPAHDGPVTALGWVPGQRHTITTGGGDDCTVCLWGTIGGHLISSTPTPATVSTMLWSPVAHELLTAHGAPDGHLILWKYQKHAQRFTQLGTVKGHGAGVVSLAQDPDCETVVSCSGDETIRFWKIFDVPRKRSTAEITPTMLR